MSVRSLLSCGLIGWMKLRRINHQHPCCDIHSQFVSSRAILGENVRVGRNVEIRDNVSIGRWTYVEPYSFIHSCSIGSFCAIGRNVAIGAFQHPYEYPTISPRLYREILSSEYNDPSRIVNIGNDVWVGEKAIILSGNIGDGAIIAAGAVVTKDVKPYSIVAGVPARQIGSRFTDEYIETLLKIHWWSWSDEEIKQKASFFKNSKWVSSQIG
ncbi:CatB-related O-acetyltransferase [Adlercreutzia sp. ZJ304]|uniref:CatB-related O-acetyltransferase n=1 Tax=Adlercreutzia sp. ZJ304 TaxID=2709791 RepID=UPI00240768CE|nr:CatB-related O-acetyltransferase [Adlercreutzia sp. ZJ304]